MIYVAECNLGKVKLETMLASCLSLEFTGRNHGHFAWVSGILMPSCGGRLISLVLYYVKTFACVYFSSLPSPPFGKYIKFPLVSSVTVPGWMPLTGLSWLPTSLGCSWGLHQLLRHPPPPPPPSSIVRSLKVLMRKTTWKGVGLLCLQNVCHAHVEEKEAV